MTENDILNRDEAIAWSVYNEASGGGVTLAQWRERMDTAHARVLATRALQERPQTVDDASREVIAWGMYNEARAKGVTLAQYREMVRNTSDAQRSAAAASAQLGLNPVTGQPFAGQSGLPQYQPFPGANPTNQPYNTNQPNQGYSAVQPNPYNNPTPYPGHLPQSGQFPGPASSAPYPSNDEQVIRAQQRQIDSASLATRDVTAPPLAQFVPQPTPSVGTSESSIPHGFPLPRR